VGKIGNKRRIEGKRKHEKPPEHVLGGLNHEVRRGCMGVIEAEVSYPENKTEKSF